MKKPKLPDTKITEIERFFGKKLRDHFEARIKNKGVSQAKFAKDLGVSQSTLNAIFEGRRGSTEKWRREVAGYIRVPYEEMVGLQKGASPSIKPADHNLIVEVINGFEKLHLEDHADHYRGVPLYESGKLAAFSGGYTFDENETPESTVVVYRPELHGRVNHDLRALRIGGDSMEPIMPAGSIVVVDLDDRECVDKKIYAVRDPRDPDPSSPVSMVKRVRKIEQEKFRGFALVSENRDHLPIITDTEWNDLVIGRVVWMWRDLEEA